MTAEVFRHQIYVIRRKVFKFFGGAFHIFDDNGNLLFYSQQKAFKLKEDIRVYADESGEKELLHIKARDIIDFQVTYDVFDPVLNEKVGSLKRKGFKSMLRDEWLFLDSQDREIGKIEEDNLVLALIRRFLSNLIPQRYTGTLSESVVCEFRQNFNPFVLKITLDFSADSQTRLDRRLGIAAGILLCAIEGRQE